MNTNCPHCGKSFEMAKAHNDSVMLKSKGRGEMKMAMQEEIKNHGKGVANHNAQKRA